MERFSDRFIKAFQAVLPSPFTIALALTVVAFLVAFLLTGQELSAGERALGLLDAWESGLWNRGLLVFAFQMMLMLVLGHTLALSPGAERVIDRFSQSLAVSTPRAAAGVTVLTMLVGFFNWGFGLIFGAILARKVGEQAARRGIPFHYPLIGAAGYSALMVWHGGLSGSALIKVAESGHLRGLLEGSMSAERIAALPDAVGLSETVFSTMNLTASLLLLVIVPAALYGLARLLPKQKVRIDRTEGFFRDSKPAEGAERLDRWPWLGVLFGSVILFVAVRKAGMHPEPMSFRWIDPDWINLLLLGLALMTHRSIQRFLAAIQEAITGAAGILIQFPLYFGIMGLITGSGLITSFSEWMVAVSNETTYPIFTFFSAGIVNVFVPSGGGQWAVQGAIIVNAATDLGLPLGKSILAMAYGDQITNMLQPFWALPLLGITGLKARDILPYTLLMLLLGSAIFILVLLLF
jgi:short-chain fatty acids transporter